MKGEEVENKMEKNVLWATLVTWNNNESFHALIHCPLPGDK